jgi:hypothetical protein
VQARPIAEKLKSKFRPISHVCSTVHLQAESKALSHTMSPRQENCYASPGSREES